MVESIKVIDLQKFEEIHREQLKCHAKMLSKDNVVLDVNHIHYIFSVMLSKILKNLKLYTGLIIVLLFILHNLDC